MSRADEHAFSIPAVQLPNETWDYGAPGLTIREHFAAMAMSSLAAHYAQGGDAMASHVAAMAVQNADALIAELAKPVKAETLMAPTRDNVVTGDILSLVDVQVPFSVIETWTDEQVEQATLWASAMHLRASDNPVTVPAFPAFLTDYLVKG